MKALTVRHPWAWAIARGGKRVENRRWGTRYRGPLAIHASKKIWRDDVELAAAWAAADPGGPRVVERYCERTAGHIVAVCRLAGCLPPGQGLGDRWALPGYWHWILDDVDELLDPVPAQGHLGLWAVPMRIRAGLVYSVAGDGAS